MSSLERYESDLLLSGQHAALPQSHVHYRTTKKGGVVKFVREHLLRDDIGCGLDFCTECRENQFSAKKIPVRSSAVVALASIPCFSCRQMLASPRYVLIRIC